MENKSTISLRAFEARAKRNYAKEDIQLCKRRGKIAERKGEYFGVAGNSIQFDADLRELIRHARNDGWLKPYEVVQATPDCLI